MTSPKSALDKIKVIHNVCFFLLVFLSFCLNLKDMLPNSHPGQCVEQDQGEPPAGLDQQEDHQRDGGELEGLPCGRKKWDKTHETSHRRENHGSVLK